MKKIILILITAFSIFSSCQKLKDPGATVAVKVANEWWVTLDSVGIPDYYGIGPQKIATYNTAANDNNIWIDDYENIWPFKIMSQVDYTNLTFSTTAAQSEYTNITVNVTGGKIFPKMGHSRSGNIADSIHMGIEFSDDPGTMYEINGVERTRFAEDDY
ncbi:MAG: lipid-binding protein [Ginsengibacter sp.]